MAKKRKNNKRYSGTDLEMEYVKGTDKNLFLDKPFMALSNLSKKKKGKEVPVNIQISDYLKSMKLLEKSVEEVESLVERIDYTLLSTRSLEESRIVKKRYKGKVYSTSQRMINLVKLYELGKITKKDLVESASWSRDPESAILVAKMIAGVGEFKGEK